MIEWLFVLADKLSLKGAFWDAISKLDLNTIGFVIVGFFGLAGLRIWHSESAVRTRP